MKLNEVFDDSPTVLEESFLRNIMVAAGVLLAALPHVTHAPELDAKQVLELIGSQHGKDTEFQKLATAVASKYHVDSATVKDAVHAALKYARPDFPTAKDILAVAGVESSFNPKAKINLKTIKDKSLKRDPALGLLQVRPGSWNLKPSDLQTIDSQIKTGADILHKYYIRLGNREAALHAYNVGMTNFKTGKVTNPRYVPKVDKDLDLYKDI